MQNYMLECVSSTFWHLLLGVWKGGEYPENSGLFNLDIVKEPNYQLEA